ncbi:MAG: DUF1826 domain-containing protein [Synoicihabitans sp.]
MTDLPADLRHLSSFPCVGIAGSFSELTTTRFAGPINALCWPRKLSGDFAEIEQALPAIDGITTLDEDDLHSLTLSPAGREARDHLIRDQRLLTEHGLQPSLDLVPSGPGERNEGPVRTDVADPHVDSATVEADTYLCTYHGAPSEGILNEDAICQIDIPETRETLRQLYDGPEGEGFDTFLRERFYDLHYALNPGARIYSFGQGHLWRIATRHPGSPVAPCIHRAPTTGADQRRRLLLIS